MLNIIKIISSNKVLINKELIIVVQNVINDEMNLTFLFLNRFTISIKDSRNSRNINQIFEDENENENDDNENNDNDNENNDEESLFIYFYKTHFLSLLTQIRTLIQSKSSIKALNSNHSHIYNI